MIWSTEDELKSTLAKVRKQCEALKDGDEGKIGIKNVSVSGGTAVGEELDAWLHKDDEISVEPFLSATYKPSPSLTRDRTMPQSQKTDEGSENVSSSSGPVVDKEAFEQEQNNEVEVIKVVSGGPTV